MRIRRIVLLLAAALVVAGNAFAKPPAGVPAAARKIEAMTINLYLGAPIFDVLDADPDDPLGIPKAVAGLYDTVLATDFPDRAEAIAELIRKERPHVIGLQEASLWTTGPFDGIPNNATDELYDFLAILQTALAARNLDYYVAGIVDNLDIEAPRLVGFDGPFPILEDLRLRDRDAILLRGDVAAGMSFSGNYQTELVTELGPQTIVVPRGYVGVPVLAEGRRYLVVNTHLETRLDDFTPPPGFPPLRIIQFFQAVELVATIEFLQSQTPARLPVVLLGDFNSDPNDQPTPLPPMPGLPPAIVPPYQVLTAAGYLDTWLLRQGPADAGLTCCQDGALDNLDSTLSERIDHIFLRPESGNVLPGPVQAEVLGDRARDRTAGNLWPSDHAFVAASIKQRKLK